MNLSTVVRSSILTQSRLSGESFRRIANSVCEITATLDGVATGRGMGTFVKDDSTPALTFILTASRFVAPVLESDKDNMTYTFSYRAQTGELRAGRASLARVCFRMGLALLLPTPPSSLEGLVQPAQIMTLPSENFTDGQPILTFSQVYGPEQFMLTKGSVCARSKSESYPAPFHFSFESATDVMLGSGVFSEVTGQLMGVCFGRTAAPKPWFACTHPAFNQKIVTEMMTSDGDWTYRMAWADMPSVDYVTSETIHSTQDLLEYFVLNSISDLDGAIYQPPGEQLKVIDSVFNTRTQVTHGIGTVWPRVPLDFVIAQSQVEDEMQIKDKLGDVVLELVARPVTSSEDLAAGSLVHVGEPPELETEEEGPSPPDEEGDEDGGLPDEEDEDGGLPDGEE